MSGPLTTRDEAASAAYSLRVEADGEGMVTSEVVADLEALGLSIDIFETGSHLCLLARVNDEASLALAEADVRHYFGGRLRQCVDRVLAAHRGGKLQSVAAVALNTADDLAVAYTPGVGRISSLIAHDPSLASQYTARDNTVAIVTDGTAVLGLGDLGPTAALPVMEGKAALFDRLAGINAVPLCLATTDVDAIVATVEAVAPSFGAINLEDIAAPRCFEIEARLRGSLDIPVLHDDQHGTAVVVLAALLNALRVVEKPLHTARITVSGAGAAGTAITLALLDAGARDVTVWAPVGVLHPSLDPVLPPHKRDLTGRTNPRGITGGLREAVAGADVFIGVSGPNLLDVDDVRTMADGPVLFGLANPTPEFNPRAVADYAAVVATGRSDLPNQINNVLAFPGLFRGALEARARTITPAMERAAADALAELGRIDLRHDRLLPEVLEPDVVPAVAAAVIAASPGCSERGA